MINTVVDMSRANAYARVNMCVFDCSQFLARTVNILPKHVFECHGFRLQSDLTFLLFVAKPIL